MHVSDSKNHCFYSIICNFLLFLHATPFPHPAHSTKWQCVTIHVSDPENERHPLPTPTPTLKGCYSCT